MAVATLMGCLPVTCQVPIIIHIALEIPTYCMHAFNLKRIGDIKHSADTEQVWP